MVKQESNPIPSNPYGEGLRRTWALFALVFVLVFSGITHARGDRDVALLPVEESGKWEFMVRMSEQFLGGPGRSRNPGEEVGLHRQKSQLRDPALLQGRRAFSEGWGSVDLSEDALKCCWGYFDKAGKIAIQATFPEVGEFSEGLALVKTDVSHGYIDRAGKIVIPAKFDKAESFSESLTKVKVAGRYGICQ